MTARRTARQELVTSSDVLPLDLMPSAFPDVFAGFTVVKGDGRQGIDMGEVDRLRKVEAVRLRRLEEFLDVRGIRRTYADRRFVEIRERSRVHWGMDHQGKPLAAS